MTIDLVENPQVRSGNAGNANTRQYDQPLDLAPRPYEPRQKQQFRLNEEAMKAMSLGATLDGQLHVFCYVTPWLAVPTFRNVLLLQCSFNVFLGHNHGSLVAERLA